MKFSPRNNAIFNFDITASTKNKIAKSIDHQIHKVDNHIVEN